MPGLAVGDAVLISQTRRETMIICQPQQRNTAGRMFGGYLMRSGGAWVGGMGWWAWRWGPQAIDLGMATSVG